MVARRIFVLFVLCALLPISALATVSYIHVRSQLLKQSRSNLRQESMSTAMSIYYRLSLLRAEMRMAASSLASGFEMSEPGVSKPIADVIKERFDTALLVRSDGRLDPLFGEIGNFLEITELEKRHLLSGKALLVCRRGENGSPARLFMSTAWPDGKAHALLIGEIKPSYLWEATERLASGIEVCVLDRRDGTVLVSTVPDIASHLPQFLNQVRAAQLGNLEWQQGDRTFVGGYWSLFTKSNFFHPELLFMAFQSSDEVFAPIANFTKMFPAILMLSLALVFVLSSRLIRRNLVPIEILKNATRGIADGGFGHKVEIRSGDEFESLGASFNEMSAKLKESQDLLVKAAKLSTMGQMAAGIMHEVKQPLTAISGLVQLAMANQTSPEGKERLETVMMAVDRLDGILARFKSFSHMSSEVMQPVSPRDILDEVIQLLEHHLLMSKTQCRVEHEEDLPFIMGDIQSLEQVFSNLLMNALDALESKEDGARLIQVRTYSSEEKVFVEVEDNGCGIPEEIQHTIFDPFFTTKSPEKGTGLGMAIVESILHKHQASIHLESEVGTGTRFTLIFPAPSGPGTRTINPSEKIQRSPDEH